MDKRRRLNALDGCSVMTIDGVASQDPEDDSHKPRKKAKKKYLTAADRDFLHSRWRKQVPSNVLDIMGDHRNLAYNWLIDNCYMVGGPYDNEASQQIRTEKGWEGGKSVTLTFFFGGRGATGAWFPNDEWETFLKYMAMDLQYMHTTPLYFNQIVRSQEVCRFVLDFDFKGPKEESPEMLVRIMTVTQRVVCRYRPTHENEVVVCRNQVARIDPFGSAKTAFSDKKMIGYEAMKRDNGQQDAKGESDVLDYFVENVENVQQVRYSMGLHPLWDFFVTMEQALQIRESIVHEMVREFGDRGVGYNGWRDVVDVGPIEKKNLRMIGCRKRISCVVCHTWTEIRAICPGCYGTGQVIDRRFYMPYMVMSGAGAAVDSRALKRLTNDAVKMMQRCSIHAPTGQSSSFGSNESFFATAIPQGEPKIPPPDTRTIVKKINYVDGHTGEYASKCWSEDRKSLSKFRKQLFLSSSHKAWDALEQFIQTHCDEHYRDVEIRDIFTNKNRTFYVVNLTGFGSRFCQNVRRDHRSNTAYFYITRNRLTREYLIHQKCHSQCVENGCNGFMSSGRSLSQKMATLLFDKSGFENKAQIAISKSCQNLAQLTSSAGAGAGAASSSSTASVKLDTASSPSDPSNHKRKYGTQDAPKAFDLNLKARREFNSLSSYLDLTTGI